MPLIDTAQYIDPGLYLVWPDGSRLDLTRRAIEAKARAMLADPSKIPPHVKAAAEYKACTICPQRDTDEICHSIMTTLPFIDEIELYASFDRVTAVFRQDGDEIVHVVETTMQAALKYVSILSLTTYCEVGRKYGTYFHGVNPLMTPRDIALAVLRSIYFGACGDMSKVAEIIHTMQEEILHTTRCQMARLRLISKSDAFLNAFVAAHTTTDFLFLELRKLLCHTSHSPSAHPDTASETPSRSRCASLSPGHPDARTVREQHA